MPTFECAIDIQADQAALFDLTQDYDRRLLWDPFLKEARLVGGAVVAAKGVRAWCVARTGLGMETEYVSFERPKVAAVRMTRGPFMLDSFAGSWRFSQPQPGMTRVVFRYHITARPRLLGRLLDPLLRLIFRRDVAERLAALRAYVERDAVPA